MKYVIFIFNLLFCGIVYSQKTPKLTTFVNDCIIRGANNDLYQNTKKNATHFYAIALSFDGEGKIDTLYYSSKLNHETKRLYSLDSTLLKRIRNYNYKFKDYANQTVLIPFFFYNATDQSIDYQSGFLNHLKYMLPEAIKGKAVIVSDIIVDANLPRRIN